MLEPLVGARIQYAPIDLRISPTQRRRESVIVGGPSEEDTVMV